MALSTRFSSRPVLNATRARQGRPGRPVLWVLIFGVALTVLGFLVAYAWKADDLASTNVNNGQQPQDARAFDAPDSPAVQTNPPPAPTGN
jgi:hypothetical protein